MILRLRWVLYGSAVLLLLSVGVVHPALADDPLRVRPAAAQEHVAWVTASLKEMQTVRIGMTRGELRKVFTEEGGLSTRLNRRYAYRECPYFKVDVEFAAVGPPRQDAPGHSPAESPKDVITKISVPFLEWSIMD